MTRYWFFLSDPDSYHFDQLFKKGQDVWDGVYGANAQKHLAQVHKGDRIIGYHTAPEKAVYALLEAASDSYADPKEKEKTIYVVDVKALRKLSHPAPLAALRGSPKLAEMKFLLIPRMAVSPLTAAEYKEILRLAGDKE
jgi:predicted RNA-binding protein with PUA-like domain